MPELDSPLLRVQWDKFRSSVACLILWPVEPTPLFLKPLHERAGDFMRSYAADVSLLLESGLPVMIYSGLEDLICNSLSQHWCGTAPIQFLWMLQLAAPCSTMGP